MRPPNCTICNSTKSCMLVYFKKSLDQRISEAEQKLKSLMGVPKKVGHPDNAEWFCERHFPRVKELSNLCLEDAINKMVENK